MRGKLQIEGNGLPGSTVIRLNGQEIQDALQGLKVNMGVDKIPSAELDLAVFEVELGHAEAPEVILYIPDATRDLLVKLGWTPPPEA